MDEQSPQLKYYYKNREKILDWQRMYGKEKYKLLTPEERRKKWNDWRAKHPDINKARMKRWRDKHGKDWSRNHRKIKRLEVLIHYGGNPPKCACCSENHIEFLELDHINGGGTQHRKNLKRRGTALIAWLKRNNFPDGFQVFCANCNRAKNNSKKQFCPVHHPELYE